jgi:hypothetical protein
MTDVTKRGRLLVCTDFIEGNDGMPHELPFDVDKNPTLIIDELARREAPTVFLVVGGMVEDHPDVARNRKRGA